jgi:hypothetical protein
MNIYLNKQKKVSTRIYSSVILSEYVSRLLILRKMQICTRIFAPVLYTRAPTLVLQRKLSTKLYFNTFTSNRTLCVQKRIARVVDYRSLHEHRKEDKSHHNSNATGRLPFSFAAVLGVLCATNSTVFCSGRFMNYKYCKLYYRCVTA